MGGPGPGPGRAVPPLDRGENVEKLWVMEFLGFTEMFSINVSFLNMNHVIQGWEAKVSKGGGRASGALCTSSFWPPLYVIIFDWLIFLFLQRKLFLLSFPSLLRPHSNKMTEPIDFI